MVQVSLLSCPDQRQGQDQIHGSVQSYKTPHSEVAELDLMLCSILKLLILFNKGTTFFILRWALQIV